MKEALNKHLAEIAATYGTPCYVYDQAQIVAQIHAYQRAFADSPHHICYAVKANDSLAILQLMHRQGLGFDVVSAGELHRVMAAIGALGEQPHKIIYSGVGKTVEEINYALDVGIDAFDIESLPELARIVELAAKKGVIAPISVRYNPNVDAHTHPYISTGLHENKFGLDDKHALQALDDIVAAQSVKLVGINMHIGSQITDLRAFESALAAQAGFVERCALFGHEFLHINCGGGLGLADNAQTDIENAKLLIEKIREAYPTQHILIEPGRSIIGRAGYLLMQVQYVKQQANNTFVIVDTGMNDYMRVALYGAKHDFINLSQAASKLSEQTQAKADTATRTVRVVGPVCESGDFFSKETELAVEAGDILAIGDVGAYGATMTSNYNARMRPAEVLLDGDDISLIRPREVLQEKIDAELAHLSALKT